MRLQISTRLAVFAVLELAAREGQQLSVAEIGEKFGISSHHLAKVMHAMGRAGLVRSVRGAGGGYQFAGSAKRTTLFDLIRIFEDPDSGERDVATADATPEERALGKILNEIDDIARATLGSITIATMLKLVERQRSGSVAAGPKPRPLSGAVLRTPHPGTVRQTGDSSEPGAQAHAVRPPGRPARPRS